MLEKAIEKINKEVGKSPEYKVFGDFLIQHINQNKADAEKVLDDKKTLEGAFKHITAEAKKKAKNRCAILRDNEVFKMLLDYYGINGEPSEFIPAEPSSPIMVNDKPKDNFDFTVDDFM